MTGYKPWTESESTELDHQNRRLRHARDKTKVPTPRPRAAPRQLTTGRWQVVVVVNGVRHQQRFDTYQQAIEWRDRHY